MSANVTLAGSQAGSFAADTTVRVATLLNPGGTVVNGGADAIWIAEGQQTVPAVDGSNQNCIKIPANGSFPLNPTTSQFAFRADSTSAQILYKPRDGII